MADLDTNTGNIRARCTTCDGALSMFVDATPDGHQIGLLRRQVSPTLVETYRLLRCLGCGAGAIAAHVEQRGSVQMPVLMDFYPESKGSLNLPPDVPTGITKEFREGERCLASGCYRAAAGMFRSVLDKTLRANGYKEKRGTNLEQQIDAAAADGAITASRQRKAHDEIRVLGNDVLHEKWREIPEADVEAARQYAQRILEDFYDDRESVLALLRSKGRVPDEDREIEDNPPS
ncbi:DUF4145 domain-containing protein [Ralstonia mannitolilytica]|uniref:DUF4145 domain-containing protein n=3 Tax=Ralstonia mannitolilytica TaxID=105219 RepID=UPI00292F93C0|nr:DUF4145 domain-containing protein [Ralstonia mannitolilytica]